MSKKWNFSVFSKSALKKSEKSRVFKSGYLCEKRLEIRKKKWFWGLKNDLFLAKKVCFLDPKNHPFFTLPKGIWPWFQKVVIVSKNTVFKMEWKKRVFLDPFLSTFWAFFERFFTLPKGIWPWIKVVQKMMVSKKYHFFSPYFSTFWKKIAKNPVFYALLIFTFWKKMDFFQKWKNGL